MCHKVSFNYNHKYNSHFFLMRLSILRKILVYKVVKKTQHKLAVGSCLQVVVSQAQQTINDISIVWYIELH